LSGLRRFHGASRLKAANGAVRTDGRGKFVPKMNQCLATAVKPGGVIPFQLSHLKRGKQQKIRLKRRFPFIDDSMPANHDGATGYHKIRARHPEKSRQHGLRLQYGGISFPSLAVMPSIPVQPTDASLTVQSEPCPKPPNVLGMVGSGPPQPMKLTAPVQSAEHLPVADHRVNQIRFPVHCSFHPSMKNLCKQRATDFTQEQTGACQATGTARCLLSCGRDGQPLCRFTCRAPGKRVA
jgi:hypothetical protein